MHYISLNLENQKILNKIKLFYVKIENTVTKDDFS
jgi:hypothetical protein